MEQDQKQRMKAWLATHLKPRFMAAALYADTLEPHQKIGAGVVAGICITTPLGVAIAWRASGQMAETLKNHFNGQGRIAHNRAVFSALNAMRGHDNPQRCTL